MYAFLSGLRERVKVYKAPFLASSIFTIPVTFLVGDWIPLLTTLVVFVCLDIVTGFCKGIVDKSLRSRKMSDGMIRKLMIFVVIIVANYVNMHMTGVIDALPAPLDAIDLRVFTILFYIVMELVSITENLGQMGFPIPKPLADYILVLKEHTQQQEPVKKVDEIIVKENGKETVLKTKGDEEKNG